MKASSLLLKGSSGSFGTTRNTAQTGLLVLITGSNVTNPGLKQRFCTHLYGTVGRSNGGALDIQYDICSKLFR